MPFSFFFFCDICPSWFVVLLCLPYFFFFSIDEWLLPFLQSKRKSDPKGAKIQFSSDDVVWPSFTCVFLLFAFFFSLVLCTYIYFFDVLPLASSCSSFLLQVEMPPPVTGYALVKKVVAAQPAAALGVKKEPPSGGVAEEVRQVVKDAQPILPSASLVAQDPKALQSPIP